MTPDPTLIEQVAPCPLCGKVRWPQFYDRGERSSYWYVSCHGEEHEHQVRAVGDTEAEAIAAWNQRPTLQGSAALPSEAMTCADCGWEGSTETWRAGCKGFPCELRATTPTAPDQDTGEIA